MTDKNPLNDGFKRGEIQVVGATSSTKGKSQLITARSPGKSVIIPDHEGDTMVKRKGKKGQRRWQGSDFKRVRRMVEGLYFTRYNEGSVKGPLKQQYRGLIPPPDMDAALYQLQNTACLWHCVSISYFQDNWGKKYRRWGFAKTSDNLRILKQPLNPVIKAAQDEAEREANLKHLYARSYIIAPWSKRYPDLVPLIKKHAKEFFLTEEDIAGIQDYLDADFDVYEFNAGETDSPEQMNDLDYQISKYL